MTYHFKIHHEDDGSFWGECAEMDNVFSEGASKEDLITNLKEALEGLLLSNQAHNIAHPLPDYSLDDDPSLLKIQVDPEKAFPVIMRAYRIRNHRTQDYMRSALGMRSRNSYVKLEREGNPTMKTVGKILKTFPDFPIEECFRVS